MCVLEITVFEPGELRRQLQLGELEVPERAEYCRVIVAEVQRIISHIMAIGVYGLDLGAFTPFLHQFREREPAVRIRMRTSDSLPDLRRERIDVGLVYGDGANLHATLGIAGGASRSAN